MAIEVLFHDVPAFALNEADLLVGVEKIVADHNLHCGEVSVVFCSDDFILEINKQHLNHDYYTDIITFDYTDNNVVCGELLVSLDTVRSNSLLFSTAFETELFRVVTHGVLHLCGLDDKSEEDISLMRASENKYLAVLSNPF